MASRSTRIWLLVLAAIAAVSAWAWLRSLERAVVEVRTAQVVRQDLHTGVVTNGKAEAAVFREVRAELDGQLSRLLVREGDRVRPGQALAEMSVPELVSEREQAAAELAGAGEALRLLQQGGTVTQVAELQAQIDAARREREQAAALVSQNQRLAERGAIARMELEQARQRLAKAAADLALLDEKWRLRSEPEQVSRAEARVAAARAALDLVETRQRAASIRSLLEGAVYSLPVRAGDHLARGDVVARVGDTRKMRVLVFVDEPDLGRVAVGQPVRLNWDGLPGRQWKGTVERLAFEVEQRDNRTGGEVVCTVDNPSGELLPNMNLNIEIITENKSAVLTIPREGLTGGDSSRTVFVIRDGLLAARAVEAGLVNPTRVEILRGLNEGEQIALLGEQPLRDGLRVRTSTQR